VDWNLLAPRLGRRKGDSQLNLNELLNQASFYMVIICAVGILLIAIAMQRRRKQPKQSKEELNEQIPNNRTPQWIREQFLEQENPVNPTEPRLVDYLKKDRGTGDSDPLPLPSASQKSTPHLTRKQLELQTKQIFIQELIRQLQSGEATFTMDKQDTQKFLGIPASIQSRKPESNAVPTEKAEEGEDDGT